MVEILLAPFPGETLSVPYLGYEPVSLLIERFKNLLGDKYTIQSEAVYFNGIGIRDTNRTIDDCKVYGDVISINFHHDPVPPVDREMLLPGEKSFIIVINTGGTQYQMAVSSANTGEDIKWKIHQKLGIGYDEQLLIFNGQVITNDRLVDYGIQDGVTLHVMPKLRGGLQMVPKSRGSGSLFADLENTSMDQVGFSDDAPDGRVVCKGMNIEADCKCTSKYRVICMIGYGLYELNQDVLHCPVCHSQDVDPVTVGFHQCEYRTHGIRANGTQYSCDWITIDNGDYNLLNAKKQCEWERLVIQTRPLEQDYDKELCVICLEALGDDYMIYECKHRFHDECISKWHGDCPICEASRL
ncbi:hypothetical protein LRAMOSA04660 [Lichtheimia ramosa]|uniref:RING-type domain-containing protein n=1 Tax=Lichtheimia ramosa TaxID=688394 RepID=A0A077WXV3_9FUNG|nr:hypothetical protein LRAMOSA04660 [Lichtheimia ramosa]